MLNQTTTAKHLKRIRRIKEAVQSIQLSKKDNIAINKAEELFKKHNNVSIETLYKVLDS